MVNLDYLYNPEIAKEKGYFDKNYFSDKKLGFRTIENGTILSHKRLPEKDWWGFGGIVNSNGEFIKSSALRDGYCKTYTPPLESIQYSSETVIYIGMFTYAWGHVITDNIRRLWFLRSDDFKRELKDCPIVYVPFESFFQRNNKNFYRLLEILEVDLDRLKPITQPTHFDKIILPDVSWNIPYFTKECREIIDCVKTFALKNQIPTPSKKVYFGYKRYQVGEERLAGYFNSKGYQVVYPENLTFDEQLNLLINAESFAATDGSCAHNSIFLRNGTETILIPRSAFRFTTAQKGVNQIYQANAIYLDSTLSIFAVDPIVGQGPNFFLVSEQLKRFFGDKWNGYEEDDFKTFLQYINNSISRGHVITPDSKEYYKSILKDFMEQLKKREDLIVSCDMPPRWETFQPSLRYSTHVNKTGWGAWRRENQVCGTLEQRDIQAIKVDYPKHKVYYSVYYNDKEGWSAEVTNGEQAGTTGKGKPIYGMRIRLDEAGAKEFDIIYRMHKFDDTWTPWAKNGEAIYSHGQKLSAIQIKLESINSAETDTKKFDYTQTFWLKDDEIYLQGQRPQIN